MRGITNNRAGLTAVYASWENGTKEARRREREHRKKEETKAEEERK